MATLRRKIFDVKTPETSDNLEHIFTNLWKNHKFSCTFTKNEQKFSVLVQNAPKNENVSINVRFMPKSQSLLAGNSSLLKVRSGQDQISK